MVLRLITALLRGVKLSEALATPRPKLTSLLFEPPDDGFALLAKPKRRETSRIQQRVPTRRIEKMTAKEILTWFDLGQGKASKSDIRKAWHMSPDQDAMQADQVQSLLGPKHAQAMNLYDVLVKLGCVPK
jgi:hypothetical protein